MNPIYLEIDGEVWLLNPDGTLTQLGIDDILPEGVVPVEVSADDFELDADGNLIVTVNGQPVVISGVNSNQSVTEGSS